MQSNSRILVNLLAKPTRTPIGIYRGGHGGADPPTSLSQAVFPPPKEGVPWALGRGKPSSGDAETHTPRGTYPLGQTQRGNPFGGVSPRILPQVAPLILGLLGFAGSVSWSLWYRFSPIYMDFLGRLFLVNSRSCIHSDY